MEQPIYYRIIGKTLIFPLYSPCRNWGLQKIGTFQKFSVLAQNHESKILGLSHFIQKIGFQNIGTFQKFFKIFFKNFTSRKRFENLLPKI